MLNGRPNREDNAYRTLPTLLRARKLDPDDDDAREKSLEIEPAIRATRRETASARTAPHRTAPRRCEVGRISKSGATRELKPKRSRLIGPRSSYSFLCFKDQLASAFESLKTNDICKLDSVAERERTRKKNVHARLSAGQRREFGESCDSSRRRWAFASFLCSARVRREF